jgi:hypothetical protein
MAPSPLAAGDWMSEFYTEFTGQLRHCANVT